MNLLVCMITYNRLAYSQKTLENFRKTVTVPHHLLVVDNYSTDGTGLWLADNVDNFIINSKNYYPGKATNIGWQRGLKDYPEATHLMRLDNDMHLEPGWDTKVAEYFEKITELGQLGLDYDAIDNQPGQNNQLTINGMTLHPWPGCVGGPCVIPRAVWDYGIRYDETPWHIDEGQYQTMQEDSKFSLDISKAGWLFGHMHEKLAWTFAKPDTWQEYPDYYKKTMTERGYPDPFSNKGDITKKAYGG